MVCVKCVERSPLYSALRSVPAKTIHGNTKNRLQEDQHRLPAKVHLDGSQGRFGQTVTSFVCVTPDVIVCDFICVFVVFSSYSGLVLQKS